MNETNQTEKKTTLANWRRCMKSVRWDGGTHIKADRDGNLWRFGYHYGVGKCVLDAVNKEAK